MIDEMDKGIGIVIRALKASGKLDNTVIFFLSDNGGIQSRGKHMTYASNYPYRSGKGSMYEGGSHVPFLVHWPAGLDRDGRFEGLVSALDISATMIALGEGDLSGNNLEGVNLIPYLNGQEDGSPRAALFWRAADGSAFAVRTMTGKYLRNTGEQGEIGLFDMESDPYESDNLYGDSPLMRAELAGLWNEWNQENIGNIFLHSADYQERRLMMYEELYHQLLQDAVQRQKVVID